MSAREGDKLASDRLFYRIRDVAELLDVKPYVLRYWETEFSCLSPEKSPTGQRIYKRRDIDVLQLIKHLLYEERYSIEGARKRIKELQKEGGAKALRVDAHLGVQSDVATSKSERADRHRRMRELMTELHELSEKTVADFFPDIVNA